MKRTRYNYHPGLDALVCQGTDRILPGDYVVFIYPINDPRNDGHTHLGFVVEEEGVLYAQSLQQNLFGPIFHLMIGEEAVVHCKAAQEYIDREKKRAMIYETSDTAASK